MKKRYLNLALAALVALFAFAGCSGGDDPPLNWPAETFKDIGLKGLELPSGIGITASGGDEEKDAADDMHYIEYVRWDNASKATFDGLLANVQAKVQKGVTAGDIINPTYTPSSPSTKTDPYKAEWSYDYDSQTFYVELWLTRKAYTEKSLAVDEFGYDSPSGTLWLFVYTID
ncbi:MAG: hypothetical protein LBT33_05310 [Spirochaetia bacterium]|jgi:hypothetical protein|nr:hypothetical protein [Spirochaetia bacterium]